MTAAPVITGRLLRVTGIVQGVGFRPFVFRLAQQHSLTGWVRNVAGTVEIHVEGDLEEIEAFASDLGKDAPPFSRIANLQTEAARVEDALEFRIIESADADGIRPVTPDLAMCADCERELEDPNDRRYRHPFITCTNCGPRYSVIESLPYDRERTSMRVFPMCSRCEAEYRSPLNRRYHAETVACPDCGPRVWLAAADGRELARGDAAIRSAGLKLLGGGILALRGVGGFHLACDATNEKAVLRLRNRKHRDQKPFAIMVRRFEDVKDFAHASREEQSLLRDETRPIVLLERTPRSRVAASVSPGLDRIGVMLSYTPLHALLLEEVERPLVMTSGNLSDEPIAIGNEEGLTRLHDIADLFLLHDREIISRIDDSVIRVVDEQPLMMRRARGHAPVTINLPEAAPVPLLAVGPHLKNTFTLVRGNVAHVSPHIGDLENIETLEHFKIQLERYERLFRIDPRVAIRDLHPGYLSTRVAEDLNLERTIAVQHHHAHIAAVAAEHGVTEKVVGLAFDGTGFGDDGTVWGAETLVADLAGYTRAAHLRYVPLPGGDIAAREPWRVALGYLSLEPGCAEPFALAFKATDERELETVQQQIGRRINTPLASSMGRLFDAAAAILGVRHRASYEGQAAMELESLAGRISAEPLPMDTREIGDVIELDPIPMLAALGHLRQKQQDVALLAARFHESVIDACSRIAVVAANRAGLKTIVLGGGSFQNARLLSGIREQLERKGFKVLVPRQLGPNDGAVSYGQAAIGAWLLAREKG